MAPIDHLKNQLGKLLSDLRAAAHISSTDHSVIRDLTAFFYSPELREKHEVRELRRRYSDLAREIQTYANRNVPQAMSTKGAEDLLTKLVSSVLSERSEPEFKSWVVSCLEQVETQLNRPVGDWKVFSLVDGLKVAEDSHEFGSVEFLEFGRNHADALLEELSQAYSRDRLELLVSPTIRDSLNGRTVALVRVKAFEAEAARANALKGLQLTVDVLNVYADMLYNPGLMVRVDLPRASRYRASEVVLTMQVAPSIQVSISHTAVGAIHPLHTADLQTGQANQLGVAKISSILKKSSNSELESAILAAMQWAGRATADDRPEESFLLYAIALESILAKMRDDFPITYRLSTRCAHLLASGLENRRRVSNEIRRLYGMRSAIVHGGKYEVSQSDLHSIRFLALNSIIAVLTDDRFSGFTALADLDEWFQDQVLLSG